MASGQKEPFVLDFQSGQQVEDILKKAEADYSRAEIDEKMSGMTNVHSNTTSYWNAHPEIVSEKNALYIYSDYDTKDGKPVPAVKIGDGSAYVVDLPFIITAGITETDIARWDEKVAVKVSQTDSENLILY